MKFNYLIALLLIAELSCAQNIKIPAGHSNIKQLGDKLVVVVDTSIVPHVEYANPLMLENVRGKIAGTSNGLYFDFNDEKLEAKLVFGLIPFGDSKHPQPVYYGRSANIKYGKVAINITQQLRGTYDMVGWAKTGKGTLGYRLINNTGKMLFDGHVSFKGTGPFEVDNTITEGPFVNLLLNDGATISFDTNNELIASVKVNDVDFQESNASTHHEIKVDGLAASTKYDYTVTYGENSVTYSFETAPTPGSRTKFTFAYASDSRSGNGGGERDIHGAKCLYR